MTQLPPVLPTRCAAMDGRAAMVLQDIEAFLDQVPGWKVEGAALLRSFSFADFHRTMAFVNAVAWIAHDQDHHPELTVAWGSCTVRFSTHSVGGLSVNDFICARLVNGLLA